MTNYTHIRAETWRHNKDERTQFFRKIYLSLYLKGFERVTKGIIREKWIGDWTELQHIDPHSSGRSSISFPFSWVAQLGAWEPSVCWGMVLIPASSLQLIWSSCHRRYIMNVRPPTSCERHICTQFNLSTVKVIPWSPDIFHRMHLLFTQVHFLSDNPAGSEVNMLQNETKRNNKQIHGCCLRVESVEKVFVILIACTVRTVLKGCKVD